MISRLSQRQKGALLMCTSALLFSSMQIAVNLTGGQIPLMEQIFFRNVVSFILCFVLIKKNGGSFFGKKKHQPLLILRSLFGFLGLVVMFYAAANGNQGDVTTLMKLSPFFITILAAIFLKEKIPKVQFPALILAFLGAAFVANPAFNSNMLPLFMALLCALFSSVAYTLLAYFKNKVDGLAIVMHFSTFSILATIPFMCMDFVLPSLHQLLLLLLIGIFGGLGQIAITYSYRMAPAGEVSIYNYSGIIFSILLGNLFLGDSLAFNSLIGSGLVIIASILVYKLSPK
ncbi:MAG: DMT family transporter [Anaerovoracaceae bacterium]